MRDIRTQPALWPSSDLLRHLQRGRGLSRPGCVRARRAVPGGSSATPANVTNSVSAPDSRLLRLGQYSDAGDASAEMLSVLVMRGHTTSGSGGSSATPANVTNSVSAPDSRLLTVVLRCRTRLRGQLEEEARLIRRACVLLGSVARVERVDFDQGFTRAEQLLGYARAHCLPAGSARPRGMLFTPKSPSVPARARST
jgi:hypothetical protein